MNEFDPSETQDSRTVETQEADLVTQDDMQAVVFDKDATQEAAATDNLTRSIEWYCTEHPTAVADFFVKITNNPSTTRKNKARIVKFFLDNNLAPGDVANNSKKLQELVTEYYLTHDVQEDTQLDLSPLNHAPIELAEIHFSALLTQFYTKEILQ